MAESYVFYRSYYEALKELDPETRLRFYDAITEYGIAEQKPEFTGIEKALWVQIQIGIDNARERYTRSVESGKKGGRPRAEENLKKPNETLRFSSENPPKPNETLRFSSENPPKPNHNLNVDVDVDVDVNENEDVNANENSSVSTETEGFSGENPPPLSADVSTPQEKPTKNQRFVKPTVAEIASYCKERANGIDAQQFYDFYEAKGWLIGQSHMKDWKASVRTWEQRRKTEQNGGRTKPLWGNENQIPDDIINLM